MAQGASKQVACRKPIKRERFGIPAKRIAEDTSRRQSLPHRLTASNRPVLVLHVGVISPASSLDPGRKQYLVLD
jgi:hypothetical protein